MKTSKRYIPILISLALLSLIALQIVWLFYVYEYKKQELKDNTREAVLETSDRLQRDENAKLIINNMDSLLLTDNIIGDEKKGELRVIVSNIKNKFKIDTLRPGDQINQEIRIVNDSSTTVVKIGNNKKHKVIIHSESLTVADPKKKAKDLEQIFLKMAINAKDAQKNIDARVDSAALKKVLRDELLKRGIDLTPDFGVSYFPKNNRPGSLPYHVVYNTPGYKYILPAMVSLPLFEGDVFGGDLLIKLGYRQSTTNFIIKQMAGLLALSLFITLLIAFVMIHIFRRMLSQEKLHQLKNDFINNMTHELKTPIATISLATDALNNPLVKNDDEKYKNYTRILKEENFKLNNHVERVLQMALLDKGELQLNKQPVDLVAIIQNAIATFKLQAQQQNATINFTPSQKEIIITGDKYHLLTVFCNLIDNALKYSDKNCEISISAAQNSSGTAVFIKDNGMGIDPALHEKVFEKFYRVQGGNLHDTKGFGLGLSYVRSIITAHNGTITLQSEKNKGSEFIIKLNNYAN
ncbi:MAG: HAMP domain-containing histidine kinase [Bacteroidia bacterium]|nr:HAMP domain-containing histidine kinase [Bacteroidia bacterium]